MPKPSSNPDKAKQGGGKVEAGNYEVIAPKYQNMKSDFKNNQLHLVFETAVLDKDGDRVKGADPVEIAFSFGSKSIESFHPGQGTGPDDSDPKDMGDDVDAEGNTVYCSGDEQFNKSCGAIVFAETLVKAGFPKTTLDQTYAPNFTGMKFSLDSLDAKTINERYGTRLNTKPMKNSDGTENAVTYKICKAWLNPTYLESGGAKAGKAAKGAAAATAETPAAGKGAFAAMSDAELTMSCLTAVAEMRQGDKGAVKTATQLVGLVTNQYTAKAKMPADRLKAVQALLKDVEWAKSAVAKVGGVWGDEPKVVVFGAAPAAEGEDFDEDGNPI